ncbi:MAG: hypothetical protein DSZ04_05870 [Sulfurimonas sp.]|nr:MAG: hypothetical protein DSZ04_05870 [Sulfurimonas sp.]
MFKRILIISWLLSSISLFAQYQEAEELFDDASCMSCHTEVDFSPKIGKVDNFKKLTQVVDACRFSNDITWFDDESLDVAKYLNHLYYKFKEKK